MARSNKIPKNSEIVPLKILLLTSHKHLSLNEKHFLLYTNNVDNVFRITKQTKIKLYLTEDFNMIP